MRKNHLACAKRVTIDRIRETAKHIKKAAKLALSVVKTAGAGPAIRASKDGLVTVILLDPR